MRQRTATSIEGLHIELYHLAGLTLEKAHFSVCCSVAVFAACCSVLQYRAHSRSSSTTLEESYHAGQLSTKKTRKKYFPYGLANSGPLSVLALTRTNVRRTNILARISVRRLTTKLTTTKLTEDAPHLAMGRVSCDLHQLSVATLATRSRPPSGPLGNLRGPLQIVKTVMGPTDPAGLHRCFRQIIMGVALDVHVSQARWQLLKNMNADALIFLISSFQKV